MGQERVPLSEVEEDRRRQFLERVHRAYQDLREDSVAWGEMQAEQREWDGTLADGLGADESWTEGEAVRSISKKRRIFCWGLVTPATLHQVDDCLRILLHL